METTLPQIGHIPAGAGLAFWIGPSRVTFKITGESTEGRYALFETIDAPQSGPPLHVHQHEDESYYILEGAYDVYLADGAPVHATVGALVTVPRGVTHTYKNVSANAGRMIVVATPAGLEHFFAALGQPDTGEAPPKPAGPPDFAAMAAVARHYGIEIVGPPR